MNPITRKEKKNYLALKFNKSKLFNKFIDISYIVNSPIPNHLITNGPQKLMNNVVKTFTKNKKAKFNKLVYSDSYILQFDNFGENILKKIIESDIKNSRVIVGPLYTNFQLQRLVKYVEKYSFIKILSSSTSATNSLINELGLNLSDKNICTIPIGVIEENKITNLLRKDKRSGRCLVYFKNRNQKDLSQTISLLQSKNFEIDLFEYGKYDNNKLLKASKENTFGILLASTESQGFAIQEMMANNLPLLVWNKESSHFEGISISGSSVPYWDNRCGLIVMNFDELEKGLDNFILNINDYNPSELIKEKLTFEKFEINLLDEFSNF